MPEDRSPRVAIVGAGIGGLTLALQLQRAGIDFTVFEAAPRLGAVGVGINLLPHATAVLHELGVKDLVGEHAVETKESAFFNRFGQHIYSEPAGRFAGYEHPQFSAHRGDLQMALLGALRDRAGNDVVREDHRVVSVDQDAAGVRFRVERSDGTVSEFDADVLVGADGVNSVVRGSLHPGTELSYTGYMMWRGTTVMQPFLSGASMVRAGWFTQGKLVVYPIRNNVNDRGDQLVNWVVEVESPMIERRDWNRPGYLEEFLEPFQDWTFDWLDVPAMFRGAEQILKYPMVDQDPLPSWTRGRITLLGDAAHPMVPRGSNGAAQSILDARQLSADLAAHSDAGEALLAYESVRRPATSQVVLLNRTNPPDAILREVYERTGDTPFDSIDDVMTAREMQELGDAYRKTVGIVP